MTDQSGDAAHNVTCRRCGATYCDPEEMKPRLCRPCLKARVDRLRRILESWEWEYPTFAQLRWLDVHGYDGPAPVDRRSAFELISRVREHEAGERLWRACGEEYPYSYRDDEG